MIKNNKRRHSNNTKNAQELDNANTIRQFAEELAGILFCIQVWGTRLQTDLWLACTVYFINAVVLFLYSDRDAYENVTIYRKWLLRVILLVAGTLVIGSSIHRTLMIIVIEKAILMICSVVFIVLSAILNGHSTSSLERFIDKRMWSHADLKVKRR